MTQRVDWLSRKAYFLDEPATRPPTHELVIGCQEIRDLVREGMGEREREKERERRRRKEEAEALRGGKGRGRVGKAGKAGRGKGGRFGARGVAPNSTEAVADADSGVEFGPRSGNGTGIENGAGMRRNSDETDSSASSTYHEHERDSRFVFLEATSSTACHNYDDNEGDEEHRGLENGNGNGRIGEEDDEEEEDDDIYGFNNKSYKYNYVYNTTAFPSNSPYQTQTQTRSPPTKMNPSLQQHPTYQDQDTPKKQEQEQEDQYHILHLTTPHSRPITVRDVLFHLDQFLYGEIPAEVWPEDAGVQEKVEVAHRLRVKHCTRTHGTKGYTRNRRLSALSGGSGLGAGVSFGGFGGGEGRGGGRGGNLGGVFGYGSGFGYGVAGGPHIRSGSVSSARTTGGGGCPTAGRGRGITGRGGLNTTSTERGGAGGGYAYTAPLCFMQVVECAGRDEMGRLVGRDRKVAARIDWMGGKFFFAGLRKPDGVYYDGSGLKGTASAGAGGDGPGWHKEGDVRVDFVLNMEGPWARRRKSAV